MKIGIMFGNPETTTGGNALKFYSSVRIDIRRVNALKEGDVNIGNHVRAKVVKNKIAPPFREAEFDILFDSGISYEGDLLDMGVNENVIDKSGAWFNYGNVRLGQGREQARAFLKENPDVAKEIRHKVLARKMPQPEAPAQEKSAKAADLKPDLKHEKTEKADAKVPARAGK
jgi:recombination protein RecA